MPSPSIGSNVRPDSGGRGPQVPAFEDNVSATFSVEEQLEEMPSGVLDFLGFDEIIDGSGLKFIEWADKATTWLPSPSFNLYFKYEEGSKTNSSPGRSLQIEGFFDLE